MAGGAAALPVASDSASAPRLASGTSRAICAASCVARFRHLARRAIEPEAAHRTLRDDTAQFAVQHTEPCRNTLDAELKLPPDSREGGRSASTRHERRPGSPPAGLRAPPLPPRLARVAPGAMPSPAFGRSRSRRHLPPVSLRLSPACAKALPALSCQTVSTAVFFGRPATIRG